MNMAKSYIFLQKCLTTKGRGALVFYSFKKCLANEFSKQFFLVQDSSHISSMQQTQSGNILFALCPHDIASGSPLAYINLKYV